MASTADPEALESLRDYLRTICPPVLNADSFLVDSSVEASSPSAAVLTQFVASPEAMALFVSKCDADGDRHQGNALEILFCLTIF